MSSSEAQKSEIHEVTDDASSSPTTNPDQAATSNPVGGGSHDPWNGAKLNPEPPSDINVIRDDTDAGGPLIIKSDDPDLNPPHAPTNPFPTDRTPEIDPAP